MKKLSTILFTFLLIAVSVDAADVRIVGTTRVDLSPIHEWIENPKGERPMAHWKQIQLKEFIGGGPWPTCVLNVEGSSKTVYLKNVPMNAVQFINNLNALSNRVESLSGEIANDTKRLRGAYAVSADVDSQYDQNRNQFSANLDNKKDDLAALQKQLVALRASQVSATSDLAMFTGQIYNKMEVWDCGQKTQ